MKRLMLVALVLVAVSMAGCRHNRIPDVLRESETRYWIPAGTPFNAVKVKGEPLTEIVVDDTGLVVIYPGSLQALEEEAGRRILRPPE